MSNVFDEAYFLRGKETGVSLFENYRWLPEMTIPMVQAIVDHCGIVQGSTILDFGCARGYVVKALRGLGFDAWGVDISEWAVLNCDSEVKPYIWLSNRYKTIWMFDWIIAKDVLEHVPDVATTIAQLMDAAVEGVFVVVPLGFSDGGKYIVPDYEKDITHIHRLRLHSWAAMFMRPGWSVEARYRLRGVKDNYSHYPDGNGFITARRVEK